jgi:hypothetical protein
MVEFVQKRGHHVVKVWLVLRLAGVVVEDSGVGFVEVRGGWLGVGNGVGDRRRLGLAGEGGDGVLGRERGWVDGVEGVDGRVEDDVFSWCGLRVRVFGVERVGGDGRVGDGKDVQGVGIDDGVLERESGLGSALPEAGEEHEEETNLGEEELGPDTGLGERVHGDAAGKGGGGGSEEREEEEGTPGSAEVVAEGTEGGTDGVADATIGFAVGAKVLA